MERIGRRPTMSGMEADKYHTMELLLTSFQEEGAEEVAEDVAEEVAEASITRIFMAAEAEGAVPADPTVM